MGSRIKIVMYHYVRPIAGSEFPGIKGLEYELFREQVEFLDRNFQMIRIEDALEQLETKRDILPEDACLLTFDDGYLDHYRYAFPVLRERHIQGSFFVPGKTLKEKKVMDVNKIHFILAGQDIGDVLKRVFRLLKESREAGWEIPADEALFEKLAVANRLDTKEVIFVKRLLQNELPEKLRGSLTSKLFEECLHTDEEAFSQKLYMNREQLLEMKDAGMYIGPHGYRHDWLGKLKTEEMREDVDRSLQALKGLFEEDGWVMNYPYGSCNTETVEYIRGKGCKLGLVTEVRTADLSKDNPYMLPRFDTNDFPPKSRQYELLD